MSKEEIPNTICRCKIDGHDVRAVYHSNARLTQSSGERFEVECDDEGTRQKVLAAWTHEWEIDKDEIKAGRRSPYSSPEGIMEDMLAKLAGGDDALEFIQCPNLDEYGIRF